MGTIFSKQTHELELGHGGRRHGDWRIFDEIMTWLNWGCGRNTTIGGTLNSFPDRKIA